MTIRTLSAITLMAIAGVFSQAQEIPQATTPQDELAAIRQQIDTVKAKAKAVDKQLGGHRSKVSKEPGVVAAKQAMEDAKKAFEAAQREALATSPEASGLLAELDALKAEEKALGEKEDVLEKAAKAKK